MKKENFIKLSEYLLDKIFGTFAGFVIGIWAASLVKYFFATRSIKNLWGLTAKKTIVDKQTFSLLEWAASVLIGYIVFEVALRFIKKVMKPHIERWKEKLRSWEIVVRKKEMPELKNQVQANLHS